MLSGEVIAAFIVLFGAFLYVYIPIVVGFTVLCIFTICVLIIGAGAVILAHITLSPVRRTGSGVEYIQKELHQFQNKLLTHHVFLHQDLPTQNRLPVIFGRTVDSQLQQLLDYIIRDFVLVYVKDYAFESNLIMDVIKKDLWFAVQKVHKRLLKSNHIKLLAHDCVNLITWHFQKIREAKHLVTESNHPPLFTLAPHLHSAESELQYLRNISEMLIVYFLPRTYSLSPSRYFLRETLACKVLQPFIDNITDPDYFNRNVLVYIEAQKVAAVIRRKTFEHATSFEDFLKTIQKTNNLETLKHMRYDIVANIIQATKLQNMNRARGLDPDQEKTSFSKSELNAAKKLKHYIVQLTFAKAECEKRLAELGWDIKYQALDESLQKLPIKSILEHTLGRKYLSHFLETVASQGLIGYWSAVEELRVAPKKNWHQLGAEIFYAFIRNPGSEIKIEKNTRKAMEEFLLGDRGPEVFYEVQDQVVQMLENKYYQLFLISDFYKEMLLEMAKEEGITEVDGNGSFDEASSIDTGVETTIMLGEHSSYAKKKLNQLQEKLNNKIQACQALHSSLKPESRVLKILQKEIEWLEGEKHQLETHITRTEVWSENLGKWRAIVQSADIPDEKEPLYFVIVVHMIESESVNEEGISSGWVVSRSLVQFQGLHRKLRPLCSNLNSLELPTLSFRFIFQQKTDKQVIEKSKVQIQKYLDFVLEDDKLNKSEAIYAFLSPSSEHLKQQTCDSPKKSAFFLTTLFKSGSSENGHKNDFRDSKEENVSQALDMMESTDTTDGSKTYSFDSKHIDDTKDAIAEPLYALMSEIFDMWGVFKYLRKTLIAFVQVTYGRTINRQIYDTISWCFSEEMLHYYITLLMKSWWPAGILAKPYPERSLEEREETKVRAREEFVSNVPEVLITLLGNNNAKCGAQKVFDTVQHKKMNKQLVYEVLEEVLREMFAELRLQKEQS